MEEIVNYNHDGDDAEPQFTWVQVKSEPSEEEEDNEPESTQPYFSNNVYIKTEDGMNLIKSEVEENDYNGEDIVDHNAGSGVLYLDESSEDCMYEVEIENNPNIIIAKKDLVNDDHNYSALFETTCDKNNSLHNESDYVMNLLNEIVNNDTTREVNSSDDNPHLIAYDESCDDELFPQLKNTPEASSQTHKKNNSKQVLYHCNTCKEKFLIMDSSNGVSSSSQFTRCINCRTELVIAQSEDVNEMETDGLIDGNEESLFEDHTYHLSNKTTETVEIVLKHEHIKHFEQINIHDVVINKKLNKKHKILKKLYKCDGCKDAFETSEDLLKHIGNLHKTKVVCDVCWKPFHNLNELNLHKKIHPLKCNSCQMGFENHEELNRHKIKHFYEKPFECEICKSKFKHHHILETHKKTHMDLSRCKDCNKEFNHFKRYINHRCVIGVMYKCKKCPEKFKNYIELNEHRAFHRSQTYMLKKSTECKLCGKNFKGLKRHMQTHNLNNTKQKKTNK